MKLGAIKYIDSNGRVHIPLSIREKLQINHLTDLNVYEEDGRIIIDIVKYDWEENNNG